MTHWALLCLLVLTRYESPSPRDTGNLLSLHRCCLARPHLAFAFPPSRSLPVSSFPVCSSSHSLGFVEKNPKNENWNRQERKKQEGTWKVGKRKLGVV